jgi:DNA repair exonuclease SbcCD ATPase subunit
MRLVQTTLYNCGPHEELHLVWHPGTNLLTGCVGAGKSTVLEMIGYALTGDLSSGLTKEERIRADAERGDTACVELVLEHQGSTATIRRYLNCSRQVLELGEQTFYSAREVQNELERWLGVTARQIAEHVFVSQWQMFAFLSMPDSARADFFNRLFGIERLRKLHTRLGELIGKLPAASAEPLLEHCLSEMAEVDGAITQTRHSIADVLQSVPELATPNFNPASSTERVKLDELVRTRDLRRHFTNLDLEREETLAALHELDLERQEVLEEMTGPAAAELRQRLGRLRQSRQQQATYNELAARKQQLEAMLADLDLHRPAPFDRMLYDETVLVDLRTRQTILERFFAGLADGRPACTECGTPRETLLADSDRHLQELEAICRRRQDLETAWQNQLQYSAALADFHRSHEHLERLLADCCQRLDACCVGDDDPATDEETLGRELDVRVKLELRLEVVNSNHDFLYTHYVNTLAKLEQLGDVEQTPESDKAEPLTLNSRCQLQTDYWPRYLQLQERLHGLEERRRALESRLGELEESVVREKERLATLGRLERLRGLFHHSAVPAALVLGQRHTLTGATNELLESFGVSYRLALDDRLRFKAVLPSGQQRPATALSGGERVLLALAFRVAIHRRFAGDTGLLVLDEPTAGLDAGSLAALESAFVQLRNSSGAGAFQLIMVTHEERLVPWFDQAHALAKGSG